MKVLQSIALVLSSGGAKGYAHIGAIKAIEEAGFQINSIAGTSMGALIGGLYAAGKLDEAYRWLKTVDNWEVYKMADLHNASKSGLLNGEFIFNKLREIIGDIRIEDLPIDYCAIATNLDNGKEVVIRKGSLLEAIRMSISMPVLFSPYKRDGHSYVDGGLVNGLPINRVVRHKGDKVIAIDLDTYGQDSVRCMEDEVRSAFISEQDAITATGSAIVSLLSGKGALDTGLGLATNLAVPILAGYVKNALSSSHGNLFSILLDSFYVSLRQNKLMMRDMMHPDLYVNINVHGYNTFSFSKAQAIVDMGCQQVKAALQSMPMARANPYGTSRYGIAAS